jgi:hypothetical protein
MLFILLVSYNREGLANYTDPADRLKAVYQEMTSYDSSANIDSDMAYFNNTSNLLYGFQRMPTL